MPFLVFQRDHLRSTSGIICGSGSFAVQFRDHFRSGDHLRRCTNQITGRWDGMVWYGMVWYGMVWYGMVWYGMVWYGMVWYGMVWYGMVWYGMVWYGMVYFI